MVQCYQYMLYVIWTERIAGGGGVNPPPQSPPWKKPWKCMGKLVKKVNKIFDIQNSGLAAIFDVSTHGAITWRTSPGFRSNLVQRDCIGGATCMPFISCLVSKVATEWPYLPPFSGLIPPNILGIGQTYFLHPQTVLQISIPFQWSYRGREASC